VIDDIASVKLLLMDDCQDNRMISGVENDCFVQAALNAVEYELL